MGSIGGTIVVGCLVLFFLFMKKRKNKGLTNQSPDFNDDDEDRKELSESVNPAASATATSGTSGGIFGGLGALGLFKFFKKHDDSADDSHTTGYLGASTGIHNPGGAGIHDLERQMNVNSGKYYGTVSDANNSTGRSTTAVGTIGSTTNRSNSGRNHQSDEDFFYRGVTNSNNLDSVFRSTTTSGQTSLGKSGSGSQRDRPTGETTNTTASSALHSRFNSFAHPMTMQLPEQFNFNEGGENESEALQSEKAVEYDTDISADDHESEFDPSDYDDRGLPGAAVPMGGVMGADGSNAPYPNRSLSSHNLNVNSNVFAGGDGASNNSRSRFAEEIL